MCVNSGRGVIIHGGDDDPPAGSRGQDNDYTNQQWAKTHDTIRSPLFNINPTR